MRIAARIALALACVGVVPTAVAQAPAPLPIASPKDEGFSVDGLARLASFMQASTNAEGYLGAVTMIVRNGVVVDWQAYGHRDLARKAAMNRDAILRIYSMTKTIATVAALMLVEDGRLALDAPIADRLPEFRAMRVYEAGTVDAPQTRPAASPITLRHLLTHTAGFATGGEGYEVPTRILERADLHGSTDLADFARRAARLPLATDPGRRFQYDGTNLEVVARLVEVASGMKFESFLRRRILAPLGMQDTGFEVPKGKRERIADLSTVGPDGGLVIDQGPSAQRPGERLQRYDSAAGGLYSTAADYARFCQMLLDGGRVGRRTILTPSTIEAMRTDQLPPDVQPGRQLLGGERFGLGGSIVVDPSLRGRAGSVGAFGWSGAASTYYTIDAKERLVAILLMQHLPREPIRGEVDHNLPKIAARFYDLVYASLDR